MLTSLTETSTTNTYIYTGNTLLDQVLSGGFPTGQLNVIYGKSNVGKTMEYFRYYRIIKIEKILNKI
jgi:archaellum biogenesis ATPase FlaH